MRRTAIATAMSVFGATMILGISIVVGIALYGITAVGIGGQNYQMVIAGKDLVADILPPPEYIIEAYLEVNLLQNGEGGRDGHIARLVQLRKDFDVRRAYWQASAIPAELKTALTEVSGGEADRFWAETETLFLPALARGDRFASLASFRKLGEIYGRHRAVIDGIVTKANAWAADVETASKAETPVLTWVIAAVAGVLLCILAAALLLIRASIVKPVAAVAALLSLRAATSLQSEAATRTETSLEANLTSLREKLYAHGKPHVVGDRLYFGDYLVNGANDIVDEVQRLHGGTATVFLRQLRVATNVLRPDGARAIGTSLAEGPAQATVLQQGEMYRGETEIFDKTYVALYEPIVDGTAVIGILYVGIPKDTQAGSASALAATGVRNEVVQMQAMLGVLETAMTAKDATEHAAMEDRRRATDRARRATAATQTQAADQKRVVLALSSALESLARTDLTHRIEADFPADYQDLKRNFAAAATILRDTMRTIGEQAATIVTVTGEIAVATDDLSRRTEQQAASLEETAAALDEITANVKRTANGANRASEIVAATRLDAERSGHVARQAVAAMGGILESSQKIGSIIGVIDEIAFQTNLLALNAGVEAARAGEAGRGFAVVAQEVRGLAQRSAEAAKEIKSLISASGQHVGQGVRLVGETGDVLAEISGRVDEISTIIAGIAAATNEQATGLGEVNIAVNQMDQFTQQNAAMVEESAAAGQGLTKQAEELARLIGRFQTEFAPAGRAGQREERMGAASSHGEARRRVA
jgi:methyl-accepting chemotaxis protein